MSESSTPYVDLFDQVVEEMMRLDPELRAQAAEGKSFGWFIDPEPDWAAVLAALRALPNDAGSDAVDRVLYGLFGSDSQGV